MTLAQFNQLTDGMPPSTQILFLNPWGDFEPAAILTIEDLVEADPLKETFPAGSIVITGNAALTNRESLKA